MWTWSVHTNIRFTILEGRIAAGFFISLFSVVKEWMKVAVLLAR